MKDHAHIQMNASMAPYLQGVGQICAAPRQLPQFANINRPHSRRPVPRHGPRHVPGQNPSQQPPLRPLPHGWYRLAGKRLLDIAFVIATLPVSGLIVAFCALALWLEGGTPFYRQDRLGKNGKVFSILKLRTMVRDADKKLAQYLENDPAMKAEWDTTQKLKNDPRITPVGAVLRATSLDELPQLWNVFKGEMSLVGPRPMMPDQLPLYGDEQAYFALQPGITGMWQVSVRNENHFSYRATVDAQYFRGLSLRHDLALLFQTIGVVVRRTGY